MADEVLAVHGLRVGYGGADVLHGVSVSLARGELTTIMGANGAGKTTLLKSIMGLVRVSEGDIRLQGESLVGKGSSEIAGLGVALVPEGRGIFPSQSIESNLCVGGWPLRGGRKVQRAMLTVVYDRFSTLYDRRTRKAGTLSGGEARLLSIAMALMADPIVLLLDEPSLGLAPLVIESVFGVIEALRDEGRSVLLVEQNAEMALRAADAAHIVHLGRVTMSGKPSELAGHPDVQAAYLGGRVDP